MEGAGFPGNLIFLWFTMYWANALHPSWQHHNSDQHLCKVFPGPSALPVPLRDFGDRHQIPTPLPLALQLRTGWSSSVRSVPPLGDGNCGNSYCTEMLGSRSALHSDWVKSEPATLGADHGRGRGRAGQGKYSHQLTPAALFVKKEHLQIITKKQCHVWKRLPWLLISQHSALWVPAWEVRPVDGRRAGSPCSNMSLLILTMKLKKKIEKSIHEYTEIIESDINKT